MNNIRHTLAKRFIAAVAAAALFSPIIASAQDYGNTGNQQIEGTVSSINGTWNLTVNDSNGYRDSVELHQGTIINPTGLTLEPGMNVTIDGYADGPNFDAMEIDTPYQYEGPAPSAVYYGPGAWYPGYAEGWGPSFSLFLNLNTHRYEERSFYAGGEVRRPIVPPSGWQNRPHGFVGDNGYGGPQQHTAFYAPRQQQPQQRYFAPQQQQPQQRYFAPQQQQPQQRYFAPQQQRPQQRTFAPQQQQRTFAPQQQPQQRTFAPQQQSQQRTFAAPSRGGTAAPRDGNQDNGRRRG